MNNMKSAPTMKRTAMVAPAFLIACAVCGLSPVRAAVEKSSGVVAATPSGAESEVTATNRPGTGTGQAAVVVKRFEPASGGGRAWQRDLPWLGVSAEEAPEVVTAQLALDPGVGLVVTYVAKDSPAAGAGVEKNDVLVEFAGQQLVHPAQLRKLVQARKEGDRVELVFCRAGKQQTVSATLARTTPGFGLPDGEHAWQGDLRELQHQLREIPLGDAFREQMKALRDSMGDVQFDQKQVQEDIRRSMEEARKAWQEAMKSLTNAHQWLGPARDALKELEQSTGQRDKRTTVTVRNTGQTVKSIVKTDEAGTITLISNPKLFLTAHDPDGKLVFDGEIETAEQRAKVPPEVWQRVEPLLEKLRSPAGGETHEKLEHDVLEKDAAPVDAATHAAL